MRRKQASELIELVRGEGRVLWPSRIERAEILSAVAILMLTLWWFADMARIIVGTFTDKEGWPIIDWV